MRGSAAKGVGPRQLSSMSSFPRVSLRGKRAVMCTLPFLGICVVAATLINLCARTHSFPRESEIRSTAQGIPRVVLENKFGMRPFSAPALHSSDGKDHLSVELPECAEKLFGSNYERAQRETSQQERESAHLREAGIDHVYIVHYTPLRYRREKLKLMLRQHGVWGEWVTGFDREVLSSETDRCFHTYHPLNFSGLKATRRHYMLGSAQRSVVAKHFSALYDAYRRNYSFIMVLEDDVLLHAGFVMRLQEVMRVAPVGFDAIFIGGCLRMYAWRRKMNTKCITKHLYRKQSSRCAHAFVLSQAGVRKFLRSLPLTAPIDFQMNDAMREEQMDVYWVEPWLSVQGTFGEATCVTKTDVKGAKSCRLTTLQKYSKAFDINFVNNSEVIAKWDNVPAFRSRR